MAGRAARYLPGDLQSPRRRWGSLPLTDAKSAWSGGASTALLRPYSASPDLHFSTPPKLPPSRNRNSLLKARLCAYPNPDLSV